MNLAWNDKTRVVYHSINPGGPNGFDTQAVERLQIEPLDCSSPRAAALSQQYILCWFFACQLIARLFLLSILAYVSFGFVPCLSHVSLHKLWKQEKTAAGNHTSGCQNPEWHTMRWSWTVVLGMLISKMRLSTCNPNFFLLTWPLFVNPAQKALIPSVKWSYGCPPKSLVIG